MEKATDEVHDDTVMMMMLTSGKRLQKTMERSTMLSMGKSTISMTIFNSYVKLPESKVVKVDSFQSHSLGMSSAV